MPITKDTNERQHKIHIHYNGSLQHQQYQFCVQIDRWQWIWWTFPGFQVQRYRQYLMQLPDIWYGLGMAPTLWFRCRIRDCPMSLIRDNIRFESSWYIVYFIYWEMNNLDRNTIASGRIRFMKCCVIFHLPSV